MGEQYSNEREEKLRELRESETKWMSEVLTNANAGWA
jgi:hypothetical protein